MTLLLIIPLLGLYRNEAPHTVCLGDFDWTPQHQSQVQTSGGWYQVALGLMMTFLSLHFPFFLVSLESSEDHHLFGLCALPWSLGGEES